MPYERESAELARCAIQQHGDLKEVVFLSGNKDYELVFADGTVLHPSDDASLRREYSTCASYAAIAGQLGGTHPYSLLAFGYQGTGPGCFATFLKTAGFPVSESDIVDVSPPLRLRADGSRVSGREGDGRIEWDDQGEAPTAPEPAASTTEPNATAEPAAPAEPPADWYADPAGHHQFRYWDGSAWTDHVADNGQASVDPLSSPEEEAGPVEFDEDGHVKKIALPESGHWGIERKGQYTYYARPANTLLEATELLRKVEQIPGLTYYAVDTPDGSLGRDMNGFYTDGPLKTKDLHLVTSAAVPEPIEFESLTVFGDPVTNQSVVASMKHAGEYARFILQMECGRCGYRSPVETEAGGLTRQCYCCGAENSGFRGIMSVMIGGGQMVEI
jgi:hypothetical protein